MIKNIKFANYIILLTLYIIFAAVYSNVVSVNYSFGGFIYDYSGEDYQVIPLLMMYLLFLPKDKQSIMYLYMILSCYFLILPAAILSVYGGRSALHFLIIYIGVISVRIIGMVFLFKKNRELIIEGKIYLKFLIIYIYLILAWVAHTSNYKFNLNFASVYEYRFDFNDAIGFPLNYILPFAAGPLMSFVAVYCFANGRSASLFFVLLAAVMFYGFTSSKSFLFGPVFSLLIYIYISSGYDLNKLLGILLIVLSLLTLVLSDAYGLIFGAMFANRVVFIPANITYEFMDQFSRLGYMYWSESKVGLGLHQSQLPINSVNYIAKIMTGDESISANVGWLPNGFMNLGLLGVFIYSVMLASVLNLIDSWKGYYGVGILVASLSSSVLFVITSIDFPAWLLTGGILPMMIALYFMKFIKSFRLNNRE